MKTILHKISSSWKKYIERENFFFNCLPTGSVTIYFTTKGPINEPKFAAQFVNPIKVPAKFGAISMWFTLNPRRTPALVETAKTRRTTAMFSWPVGRYPKAIKEKAGRIKPEKLFVYNEFKQKEDDLPMQLKIFLLAPRPNHLLPIRRSETGLRRRPRMQ